MNSTTTYNHMQRLRNRIDALYSSAEHYCPTHKELIASVQTAIREDPAWTKLPTWARAVLNEHDRARFDRIQRDLTIWLFPQPEGPALSWGEMPEDVRKTYCSADKKGQTYWLRKVRPGKIYSHTYGEREGNTLIVKYEITNKIW
jgi:hypothetical protein